MDEVNENRLARVQNVSKDGRILLMEKCVPLEDEEVMKESAAYKMTLDRHEGNYGYNEEGEIVCIDYSQRFSSDTVHYMFEWYAKRGIVIDFTKKRVV